MVNEKSMYPFVTAIIYVALYGKFTAIAKQFGEARGMRRQPIAKQPITKTLEDNLLQKSMDYT